MGWDLGKRSEITLHESPVPRRSVGPEGWRAVPREEQAEWEVDKPTD